MQYRYQNIQQTKFNDTGSVYYLNNIYPDISFSDTDNYVIATMGDRLDLLAFDFYGDSTLYWVIASANSISGDSLYPDPGMQLRIPSNIQAILNSYKLINNIR
jgi:nucleoid-associated protein YgaU